MSVHCGWEKHNWRKIHFINQEYSKLAFSHTHPSYLWHTLWVLHVKQFKLVCVILTVNKQKEQKKNMSLKTHLSWGFSACSSVATTRRSTKAQAPPSCVAASSRSIMVTSSRNICRQRRRSCTRSSRPIIRQSSSRTCSRPSWKRGECWNKTASSHSIFAPTDISTQFLLVIVCVCVRACMNACVCMHVCVGACMCMYDTDQCRTHLNSLWFLCVWGWVGCLSISYFI